MQPLHLRQLPALWPNLESGGNPMQVNARNLVLSIALIAVCGLAACAPSVPDSAAGAGVNDPFGQNARDSALETSSLRVPETVLPPADSIFFCARQPALTLPL